MIYDERVDFTLPGSSTPASLIHSVRRKVSAVEFTSGGQTRQAGFAANFGIESNGGSATLAATIYSDTELDFETGPTFTVSGLSVGNLTVDARDKTVLLPLLF